MWQGLKIWGSRGSSAYRACARLAWSSVTSPPRRNPDFQRARLGARKPRGLATSRNSFTGGLRDPSRMAPGSRTPRKTRTQRASRSASRPVLTEAHAACPLPTGAYIPLAAARTRGTSFRIPPGPGCRPARHDASSKSLFTAREAFFLENRQKEPSRFLG